MATSSTSFSLRIPATYPNNQAYAGSTGVVATDTESQPSISNSSRAVQVNRAAFSAEKRKVQVQTKVFRTDTNGFDFQSNYTTVDKSLL